MTRAIFEVLVERPAIKQLAALPRDQQRRLRLRIDSLAEEPRPPGAKLLREGHGILRIRVGDYRILYRVEGERLVVIVVTIGHRKAVYRDLA